jgi:hypothetical protein
MRRVQQRKTNSLMNAVPEQQYHRKPKYEENISSDEEHEAV